MTRWFWILCGVIWIQFYQRRDPNWLKQYYFSWKQAWSHFDALADDYFDISELKLGYHTPKQAYKDNESYA